MKKEKILKWFEPIGLALLLIAFGWQCMDEHLSQMKMEGYLLETNEKLLAIWDAVYDEALRSNRYDGRAAISVNYDVLNNNVKTWGEVKEELSTIDKQESSLFWIWTTFYVLGSMMIIVAKIPYKQ